MDFQGSIIVSVAMMIGAGSLGSEPNRDFARFQGSWSIVSVESRGEKEAENTAKYTFTFHGNELIFLDHNHVEAAMKYELDETQCPRQISFGMVKGIYDFKDEHLRICYTMSGKRPTMLMTSRTRPREVLVVLKKERLPILPATVSRQD